MMSIKGSSKDWKALLTSVKLYTDEATINVGDGKAWIQEIDTSKNNMIYGEIDCEGEGNFAVPLEKMLKALSAVGEEPDIEIDDGYLTIYGQSAKVTVPLIMSNGSPSWPDKFNKPTASCEIDPALLDPVLAYAKFCNQGLVRFIIGDTKMKVEIGEAPNISEVESQSTAVGEACSTFGMELIDVVIKHVKAYPALLVEGFSDNFPMVLSWHNEGTGKFKVLVAPRIED